MNDSAFLGFTALTFGTIALVALSASTCDGSGGLHNITGTVASPVQSKSRVSGSAEFGVSGSDKFAVTLKTSSGLGIYNCSSTQCAGLVVGSEVVLSCYLEWHPFGPDEEECRFARIVSLPDSDG